MTILLQRRKLSHTTCRTLRLCKSWSRSMSQHTRCSSTWRAHQAPRSVAFPNRLFEVTLWGICSCLGWRPYASALNSQAIEGNAYFSRVPSSTHTMPRKSRVAAKIFRNYAVGYRFAHVNIFLLSDLWSIYDTKTYAHIPLVLHALGVEFSSVNILEHPEIREGIKVYS